MAFVQRAILYRLDFLPQAVLLESLVTFKADGQNPKLGRDLQHQVDHVARQRLALDLDELKKPGLVE